MSRLGLLLLAVAICVVAQSPKATDPQARRLSPEEQRGKDIYFGIDVHSDRPIIAVVGNSGEEMTGSLAACANCHGKDGRGVPDAAIDPSDISWASLMKPRNTEHLGGRNRPAYTERLIVRAVCMGIDAGGNKLHIAMPRFTISRDDMSALISYLKLQGPDIGSSHIVSSSSTSTSSTISRKP